jgi:hypothetical protein
MPDPLIHLEKNGSSEGWITTTKGIVALNADQFVPGHGNLQTKRVQQNPALLKYTPTFPGTVHIDEVLDESGKSTKQKLLPRLLLHHGRCGGNEPKTNVGLCGIRMCRFH